MLIKIKVFENDSMNFETKEAVINTDKIVVIVPHTLAPGYGRTMLSHLITLENNKMVCIPVAEYKKLLNRFLAER